ncbi:MAG: hypothetical protein AAGC80_36485 [Rhodococcus sp. (in: high G+C Gram-positive bacteria)]
MAKLIGERPVAVKERFRIGDFESALIIGRRGESVTATLADRKPRLVKLVRLGKDRGSESVDAAIRTALLSLPAHARRT